MELPLIIMFASLIAAFGGGAQQTVGQLAHKLSKSSVLPGIVVLSSALTAFVMAYLGAWISWHAIGMARALIVAAGLAFAALGLFRSEALTPMREPTRSIGAIFLALLGKQILDAPRWLVFAGGAAIAQPFGVALGATVGSSIALLGAWFVPAPSEKAVKIQFARRALATLALMIAAFVVWKGATFGS